MQCKEDNNAYIIEKSIKGKINIICDKIEWIPVYMDTCTLPYINNSKRFHRTVSSSDKQVCISSQERFENFSAA